MALRGLVWSAALLLPGEALQFDSSSTDEVAKDPLEKVVTLLTELKTSVEADGVTEQASYDKFACWCEDTLAKKADDITKGKDSIEALRTNMIKLRGDVGSHEVEIKQLGKDITANKESQKEAEALRDKEKKEHEEETEEAQQCIGALKAAIDVLSEAGSSKTTNKGFLETMQQAQLLSVVSGVRGMLRQPIVSKSVGEKDLELVRRFVEQPRDFVGKGVGSMAQVAGTPYGDYAPQSTQIQGILKTMLDTFTEDIAKALEEEGVRVKAFDALMDTKGKELSTLKTTLQSHTGDVATKKKTLADSKIELDDTLKQLDADENFFSETKGSCKGKAAEWSERTHLRSMELTGIGEAIKILTSDEAKATFANASATFLQTSSNSAAVDRARDAAFAQLRTVASESQSLDIARLASKLQAGGHFDKIITMIDKMIGHLREDEQQDIKERDYCEARETKNKNDMEDLNSDITKADNTITRLQGEDTELGKKVDGLETDINTTETNLEELKTMRIEESQAFVQGVKDDAKAVELLEYAIKQLSKTYGPKKASLLQSDPKPETSWKGDYSKKEGEGRGVVAILTLLKEDFEQEIAKARQDDADSQVNYESDRGALSKTLKAQEASQRQVEKEKAEVGLKMSDTEDLKTRKSDDLTDEDDKKSAIKQNCDWVKTHFTTRRDKRQKEIQGLEDAKNYLAGVDS